MWIRYKKKLIFFLGCKFKFFWWYLFVIIRVLMFVIICIMGFYVVVFFNYEFNLVSIKKWFGFLINGFVIEMDYYDFKRSFLLRFVILFMGWFSCCCLCGLDFVWFCVSELIDDIILKGLCIWFFLLYIIYVVFLFVLNFV